MARFFLTVLAIFAMIYSAVALPAVKGRQLEGDIVPIPIFINVTIGAPNVTYPAPNGTESNSTKPVVLASRTRRGLRSFPIDLPVPYKA